MTISLAAAHSLLTTALAQAPAAPPQATTPSGPAAEAPTLLELFNAGPAGLVINIIILLLSLAALAVFAYTMLSLTPAGFIPQRFVDDVTKLILGRRFDQAINLCQNNSRVFSAGVVQRLIENREKDHGVLIDILESEGRRRAETVWNRINYLVEIAAIAPTLGLLGTVVGMIDVFWNLTQREAPGDQVGQLAGGIGMAMGTTMFGLIVAIAAGVFYTLARSRATKLLGETEMVCHTIVDHTYRAEHEPAATARPGRLKARAEGESA